MACITSLKMNETMMLLLCSLLTIGLLTAANPNADRLEDMEPKVTSSMGQASKLLAVYGRPFSGNIKRAGSALDTLSGITMGKRTIKSYDDSGTLRGYLVKDSGILNNFDEFILFVPETVQQQAFGHA